MKIQNTPLVQNSLETTLKPIDAFCKNFNDFLSVPIFLQTPQKIENLETELNSILNQQDLPLEPPSAILNISPEELNDFLILCISHKKLSLAKLLLSFLTMDINKGGFSGTMALHKSCEVGSKKMIELLLSIPQIDINLLDRSGNTPLHIAYQKNLLEIVTLLLNQPTIDPNKARDGWTPLIEACASGNQKIVELLLAHSKIDVNTATRSRETPLDKACVRGHIQIVKLLLDRSEINLNPQDYLGNTPLLNSCSHEKEEIVTLLLSQDKININLPNFQGNTPLHQALEWKKIDIIKLFLSHPKIDLNLKNKMGWLPLHAACRKGLSSIVKLLLAKNEGHLNQLTLPIDGTRHTPLTLASYKGDVDTIQLLLDQVTIDIDPLLNNIFFIQRICRDECEDILQRLLNHFNINVNQTYKDDLTLLNNACKYGQKKIVELLLTHPKIDINTGKSLFLALINSHTQIAELLLLTPHIDLNISVNGTSTFDLITQSNSGSLSRLVTECFDIDETTSVGHDFITPNRNIITYILAQNCQVDSPWQHLNEYCLKQLNRHSTHLFALTVLLCDEFLIPKTDLTPRQKEVMRFFSIAQKLPIELQMVLSKRTFNSPLDIIFSKDFDPALKSIYQSYHSQ